MSENLESKEQQQFNSALNTRNVRISPNLVLPQQLSSVHVDKAMVAVDHESQTVTMTLLSSHPILKISERWDLENLTWEVVGEIKMPVTAMNAVTIYYLAVMTGGLDILKILTEEMQKHKRIPPNNGTSYGPFDIIQGKPQTQQQEQPSEQK